jgi:L-ascorbate metabolism protein UlaG (beta-lactamase superfamily)
MKILIHVLFLFLLPLSLKAEIKWGWSGIAGIYLTDGKSHLFFDPVFSRPSIPQILMGSAYEVDSQYVRSQLNEMNINKIDGIFIGHSHFDHALDMHVVNRLVGGKIYGTQTTAFLAQGHGLRDDQYQIVANGHKVIIGDFTVQIVDSQHGMILGFYEYQGGEITKPLKRKPDLSDYLMGGSFSFYVTHPKGEFFVHQASRTSKEIQELLKGRDVKILFQGIANRKSSEDLYSGIIEHAQSVELVIPIHHDNFFLQKGEKEMNLLWGVDLEEFVEFSKQKNQKILLPVYNSVMNL